MKPEQVIKRLSDIRALQFRLCERLTLYQSQGRVHAYKVERELEKLITELESEIKPPN